MKNQLIGCLLIASTCSTGNCFSQKGYITPPKTGWLSIGVRSTQSLFSKDGSGIGTGGQVRWQLSNRVNTDWYADYITTNVVQKVRSIYYHIGWSVLFYPFPKLEYPRLFQPYIVAGHCFEYNKKAVIDDPSITKDRWGASIQAGAGNHFNLTEKLDISLSCQWVVHLSKSLDTQIDGNKVTLADDKTTTLEGHLLTTISMNFKLFRLWKK
jgi:hypothetical protein